MKHIAGLAFALLLLLAPEAGWSATTINVRAGIHDRYNRLVFDWAEPVKYVLKQNGSVVMIQFNKPATANFKDVGFTNPPFIRNIQQENKPEGLFVSFEIPDQSRVQAFWSGQKVAFDVLRLSSTPPQFKTEQKPAEKLAEAIEEPKEEVQAEPAPAAKIAETSGPQQP